MPLLNRVTQPLLIDHQAMVGQLLNQLKAPSPAVGPVPTVQVAAVHHIRVLVALVQANKETRNVIRIH